MIRRLQNYTWIYNEESGVLLLEDNNNSDRMISLNRTHAFSLARFLIRVFFRMSMKKKKTKAVDPAVFPDETLKF